MKQNEYKCAICGNVYEKAYSDEEAMEECVELFGEMSGDDLLVVCDDCFEGIDPRDHKEELEKSKREYGLLDKIVKMQDELQYLWLRLQVALEKSVKKD
jgi:hypothetical protein